MRARLRASSVVRQSLPARSVFRTHLEFGGCEEAGRSLSPRAAHHVPSTAAMKPSGSTRLIVSELTLLLRNSVLGCRGV